MTFGAYKPVRSESFWTTCTKSVYSDKRKKIIGAHLRSRL